VPVTLSLRKITDADPVRGWVPAEFYDITVDGQAVGTIQLRLGNTDAMRLYGGHVGYNVEPEHRGHGYASAVPRQLRVIASQRGFGELWITCRSDNVASQRALQKAGAQYIETIAVPG
jgi:predicted acetyltransferase